MDRLNLLSGDDAEERTLTAKRMTHRTHTLAGRNCGWRKITAVHSSGVLMLGVGGRDVGFRMLSHSATQQGHTSHMRSWVGVGLLLI